MTKTDTAALAANDDSIPKTIAEHLDQTQASIPEAVADVTPSPREAQLYLIIAQKDEELRAFRNRREEEMALLGQRDGALHAIEGAKSRLASEKQGLAEIEEQIAALLRQPMPTPFGETPVGEAAAAAAAEGTPPWESILPKVTPDQIRILDGAGEELPGIDALIANVLDPEQMKGEKRAIKGTCAVYGTPWLVSHLWKDEASGAVLANVLRLYSKDEWAQTCEATYGRAVDGLDQTDEAREQRQTGGEWCGLVVKVGRKTWVVGPQRDALHLAYAPPVAEPVSAPAAPAEPFNWAEFGRCVREVILATGMTVAAYALHHKLPQIPLVALAKNGTAPELEQDRQTILDAFPREVDADEGEDDSESGQGEA